jgi:hypothetical protein
MAAAVVACNFSLFTVHLFLVKAIFNAGFNEKIYQGTASLKRLFMEDGEDRHDL